MLFTIEPALYYSGPESLHVFPLSDWLPGALRPGVLVHCSWPVHVLVDIQETAHGLVLGPAMRYRSLLLLPGLRVRPIHSCPEATSMKLEHLQALAYSCGAEPRTDNTMRVLTGVSMTFDQLMSLANRLQIREQERCCSLIFGHCESDNVAQRTVDAIRKPQE